MTCPQSAFSDGSPALASSRWERAGLTGFGVLLVALAAALVWVGIEAIQQRQFVFQWSGRGTATPVQRGTTVYTGLAAVRTGAGMCAVGIVLALWSLGMLSHVYLRFEALCREWILKAWLIGIIVFLGLAAALLFRPWTPSGATFWGTGIAAALVFSSPRAIRFAGPMIGGFIVIALIVSNFSARIAGAIPLGLFVGFLMHCHVWALMFRRPPVAQTCDGVSRDAPV